MPLRSCRCAEGVLIQEFERCLFELAAVGVVIVVQGRFVPPEDDVLERVRGERRLLRGGHHVNELLDTKLADVQQRLDQLTALRAELRQLVDRGRALDPADCTTDDICHILRPAVPT